MQAQANSAPRGRGRPRKQTAINPQFPGVVIPFTARPRLVVGDVVELCRGCLASNAGKLAIVTGFDEEGFALVRSVWQSLDAIDLKTGEITHGAGHLGRVKPENLYRRSRDLAKGMRHV